MNQYHLTYATSGRVPFLTCDNQYLKAIRTLANVAGNNLALYNFVDEHIHLVILSASGKERIFSRSILQALRPLSTVKLEPAHITAIDSRKHLERLVPYILKQSEHHHLDRPVALWPGSCFPDLVGARFIDGFSLQIKKILPRLHPIFILSQANLKEVDVKPMPLETIKYIGLARMLDCSVKALCAVNPLAGREKHITFTRAALYQLALSAGYSIRDICEILQISRQGAFKLKSRNIPEEAITAIRIRMALENAILYKKLETQ